MSEPIPEAPEARPLHDLRLERLLTVRELARAAGILPTTPYRLETGRPVKLRASAVRAIAGALGVQQEQVAELRPRGWQPGEADAREVAARLEAMGYPPLLARRTASHTS